MSGPWYTLERRFVIEPGEAALPTPPISGKTDGPRPALTVLELHDPELSDNWGAAV